MYEDRRAGTIFSLLFTNFWHNQSAQESSGNFIKRNFKFPNLRTSTGSKLFWLKRGDQELGNAVS